MKPVPAARVKSEQKLLSSDGASTQFLKVSSAVGVLIAFLILMSYQSAEMVKPGTKRGRSTSPAVQVLAVSSRRLGLPPVTPGWLVLCSASVAGLNAAIWAGVRPAARSCAWQLAARVEVPSARLLGSHGSSRNWKVP